MDYLVRTRQLINQSDMPKNEIAAACKVSTPYIYNLAKPWSDPGYSRLKRVYEYLSKKKMEV
jgi:predicted transcriptional regulator